MKAITALALCTVLSAAPALVVGASNGSFDSPPPDRALSGLAPDVRLPEAAPDRFTTETVVVAAPAPRKATRVAYRGPRPCETRGLEHTGGNVRVCARPATPITHRTRSANELAKLYR